MHATRQARVLHSYKDMEQISVGLLLLSLSAEIASVNGQSCSSEGQLRLFQTASVNSSNAGRVEICMGGVLGTIAADSTDTPWNEKNAQVACIQLGFTGALNGIRPNTIPFAEHSSSPIHLKSILCDGTESNITSCFSSSFIGNTVGHGHDAFIVCRPQQGLSYSVVHPGGVQSGDIRLFGDTRNGRGAVQIYSITMGWQGICPDISWTDSDATTICRDLGYDNGSVALPVDVTSGPGGLVPSRRLYDAKCPGIRNDDVSAGVCSFRVQRSSSGCTVSEQIFAAVQCNNARDQSVRLIGGNHSREGIVEVAYNGRWGMVCNTDFGQDDARSICKGLGYGNDIDDVSVISTRSSPILVNESNLRPIWLDMLSCSSSDSSISACVQESNIIGYADCLRTPGSSIAAVDCGNESSGISGGTIAGIVIGSIFAVVVLVFCILGHLDKEKKKKAAAAARARAAQSQNQQTALVPVPPPETQPAPQPAANSESSSIQESEPKYKFNLKPSVPQSQEPSASQSTPELSKPPPPFVYDVQPDYLTNPQDEPPPYPGGPSAPAAYPAAGYPQQTYPVSWNDLAYPPASAVPYPVTDSAPYPP